jgi:predicted glycosyltransferase
MDRDALRQLAALAEGHSNIEIIEFCANFEALVAKARVALAMGGYNTTLELAAARVPTIYLPRTYPREEQLVRANTFEILGFGRVVSAGEWSLEMIVDQLKSFWARPILDDTVTLEIAAIPLFASQIVVPGRSERFSGGPIGASGDGVESKGSSVPMLDVDLRA